MINNVNIEKSFNKFFVSLSFQAPTMSGSTPGGSLSKIRIPVVSPEQEEQRQQQSTPHLCPVQKLLRSDTFTSTWSANNKNNAENNRPVHKWDFKKTVRSNNSSNSSTSGSKNHVIKSIDRLCSYRSKF